MTDVTALVDLPAKLDQPDHPIGMGFFFVCLVMGAGIVFMVVVMIGTIRSRNRKKADPIDYPILLKPEDKIDYRPTNRGRPQKPRD